MAILPLGERVGSAKNHTTLEKYVGNFYSDCGRRTYRNNNPNKNTYMTTTYI